MDNFSGRNISLILLLCSTRPTTRPKWSVKNRPRLAVYTPVVATLAEKWVPISTQFPSRPVLRLVPFISGQWRSRVIVLTTTIIGLIGLNTTRLIIVCCWSCRNQCGDEGAFSSDPASSALGSAQMYASHSNPDLTSICYEDPRADFPEHVLKVFKADQTCKYLLIHKVKWWLKIVHETK